jgi:hypothetical protein
MILSFINNQTTWYNTKEKELKELSTKIQMEYPEGRLKMFRKKLRAIQISKAIAIGVLNITETINGMPSVEKFLVNKRFQEIESLLYLYYNIPFGDGYESGGPISKKSNEYHCMHENNFKEHIINQQKSK